MSAGRGGFSGLLRLSAVLLLAGLCIEAISLHWIHPIAFLVFLFVGCVFLGVGVLLFLYSLVFSAPRVNPDDSGPR
jgi:hypothetical protein